MLASVVELGSKGNNSYINISVYMFWNNKKRNDKNAYWITNSNANIEMFAGTNVWSLKSYTYVWNWKHALSFLKTKLLSNLMKL